MSRQPQADAAQSPQAQNVPLCKFDEHMMRLIPTYKPLDEQQLTDFLLTIGATKDTLPEYLQSYNHITERKFQTAGVKVIGVKPLPDDPNVYSVRVPDSPYAIRMWDGGMAYWGQFCLDFFDVARGVPVNLPAGYALYPGLSSRPPGIGAGHALPAHKAHLVRPQKACPLGSWERNLGMTSIPDGEEKWSIPEGSYLTLRRDGHPDFAFQMPTRQPAVVAAQPQLG